ncbi:hypothetical protein CLOSTHATH_06406 [Hungatella hathewayi DSM 13479]|uniref:Uncharacterized protein n=1 Tax=Hungatella hathewayi DSM 13479 TaxID=566550 RepID=D3AS00_9FIRM|nr:hypothetical protein CLOSTHATH_06406 [Hungatella hathewayi DSM 13479]
MDMAHDMLAKLGAMADTEFARKRFAINAGCGSRWAAHPAFFYLHFYCLICRIRT